MMRGYDGPSSPTAPAPNRYRVVRSGDGWRVEVNGCFTAPIADRKTAVRLARSLQRECDHLRGRRTRTMPQ